MKTMYIDIIIFIIDNIIKCSTIIIYREFLTAIKIIDNN